MSLTRTMLKALGIEEEKASEIITAHLETVDALKKERDDFKAKAEKLPEVQAKLEKAEEAAKHSGEYDKLKQEFEDYKAEVASKETLAQKKAVLSKLAKDAGLSEAGIAKALKYAEYDKLELDDKGEAKDAKNILKGLKEEWADYVQTIRTKGTDTPNPPSDDGGKAVKTKKEILEIKDTAERQAAWREFLTAQRQ